MNHSKRTKMLLAALASFGTLGGTAWAVDNPEVEPNDTKALATPVTLSPGDTISGTCTGTGATGGTITTYDYFRIKTEAQPVGIYRYRLEMTPSATAWADTIRGLNQSPVGTIGTTDSTAQTASTTLLPGLRSVEWYGFGKEEEIYYRVGGTTSTTGTYSAVLVRDPVAPIVVNSAISPGDVTIGPATGNTADIDWWLYDSNLNAIPCAGIDSGNPTGVRTVTLAPGTYYLAFSTYNFANDQASCAPETFAGIVLDFPNAASNSSTSTSTANLNAKFTSSAGTFETTGISQTEAFYIPWIQFTVGNPSGACCATDGTCSVTLADACPSPNLFQGMDSTCTAEGVCPITVSACCSSFGSCVFVAGSCPANTTQTAVCSPNPCVNESCGTDCGPGTTCGSVNGKFESGDLTAWQQYGSGTLITVFTGTGPGTGGLMPHSGTYALDAGPTATPPASGIRQTIPAHAGDQVTVSFWYGAGGGTPANQMIVMFDGQTLLNIVNEPQHDYQQQTYTVTVANDNPILDFAFYNAPTYFFLDDISVCIQGATASGVCCRGATCNTTITSAGDCTSSGMAGALFVSGSATCNPGAVSSAPCCYANYNKTGGVTVQDIFDFLSDWFASSPYANVGGDGAATPLTVQNIFDFLSDWFAGGCG